MTDPLLHAWLLEIATAPPEAWYGHGRLALADWLEERGDSRADAVRDQAAHDVLKRERDDQIRRRIAAGGLTRGEERILGLAFNVPVRLGDATGDRERQRLLSLFPDVTLTGPCPCHEPLPEGASVTVMIYSSEVDVRDRIRRRIRESCVTCGDSGARTARAANWLIWQWINVAPRTTQHWQFQGDVVLANTAGMGFRLPVDPANPGHPLIVLPATNLVGEPL